MGKSLTVETVENTILEILVQISGWHRTICISAFLSQLYRSKQPSLFHLNVLLSDVSLDIKSNFFIYETNERQASENKDKHA